MQNKVFQKLERKIRKKKRLKRCDVFSLLLTPLMSGTMEISERICRGMDILESPGLDMKEEDVKRMQSVLYALAVKFFGSEPANGCKGEDRNDNTGTDAF